MDTGFKETVSEFTAVRNEMRESSESLYRLLLRFRFLVMAALLALIGALAAIAAQV